MRHGLGGGKEGGTLTGTYASFPDYLDPALSYTAEGWTAMYDTYIPLLTYAHANGAAGSKVIPGLAESLPKITNGGKTYTLTLRKGLKYSDGTPVKASDFTYAVERMFKLNSPGTPFYTDIVGAEEFAKTKSGGIPGIKTDDKTGKIVIDLVKPRGTFTNELGLMFVAPVPPSTPAKNQTSNPPPATGPYAIVKSEPGRGWSYERNPQWAKTNSKLMPEIPSGHVDKIDISGDPQPDDPGQRSRTGQVRLDADPATARPLRQSQGKVRRHPVPGRADDQHLLLLDEHEEGAIRRPQGPPGGQLRDRHRSRWNGSTPARSPPPSRSCRRGCPATRNTTSTRTTWPRRRR